MQQVVYVSRSDTTYINQLVKYFGYRVISVTPVHQSSGIASSGEWGAYFVLEKEN